MILQRLQIHESLGKNWTYPLQTHTGSYTHNEIQVTYVQAKARKSYPYINTAKLDKQMMPVQELYLSKSCA